jgi:hypothetical protein
VRSKIDIGEFVEETPVVILESLEDKEESEVIFRVLYYVES